PRADSRRAPAGPRGPGRSRRSAVLRARSVGGELRRPADRQRLVPSRGTQRGSIRARDHLGSGPLRRGNGATGRAEPGRAGSPSPRGVRLLFPPLDRPSDLRGAPISPDADLTVCRGSTGAVLRPPPKPI